MIVLLKIVAKPAWWLVMFIIPFANIVFLIWILNMPSKSFDKDGGFTVGLVLLGIVYIPILALGDARYQGLFGDPVAFQAYSNRTENMFDVEQGKLHGGDQSRY